MKPRSIRACVTNGFQFYMGNFRRIWRATWLPQLVFAIVSGLAEALLVSFYPIVVAALLVLYYVLYRFLLRRRLTMLTTVKGGFSAYFRHAGLITAVALVTLIICAVAWLLTSTPAVILGIANIQAEYGVQYGDPLGMPDYMKWLTMGVFTLASFMQAYIYLAYFFPLRYAQGSAVAVEAERTQALHKLNNKDNEK